VVGLRGNLGVGLREIRVVVGLPGTLEVVVLLGILVVVGLLGIREGVGLRDSRVVGKNQVDLSQMGVVKVDGSFYSSFLFNR
jgi:hypothetical protein